MVSKSSGKATKGGVMTGAVIALVINALVLYVMIQIKNDKSCKCNDNKEREFLQWGAVALIVINLYVLVTGKRLSQNSQMIGALGVIFSLVYFIILVIYLTKLKSKECECNESTFQKVIRYYSYFVLAIYALLVAIGILLFLSHML